MSAKDLTKEPPFGKVKVLERAGTNAHGQTKWRCRCECGVVFVVVGHSLRTGNTKSCGCISRERGRRLHAEYMERCKARREARA